MSLPTIRECILLFLKGRPRWRIADLLRAVEVDRPGTNQQSVRAEIGIMVAHGLVERMGDGVYRARRDLTR